MKKIPHILFSLTLALIIILAPQKFIYADAPLAAQLLAQPYDTTGIRVTVTNSGNMYGLATDGTDAWIINQDGNLVQVPLAGLASQTPGSSSGNDRYHTSSGLGRCFAVMACCC
jgi:hypothetical protein